MNHPVRCPAPNRRLPFLLGLISGLLALAGPLLAKPTKEERAMKREALADDPSAKPKKADALAEGRERKAGGTDPQARLLAKVREQMEISDDGEWAVIVERIGKVDELRRAQAGGNTSPRAASPAGDRIKRSAGNSERDPLRTAVADKLPDAEIKARLLRAREVRQQHEARLATAQAELRAVLTVRQEAIAVLAGWLTP